MPEATILHAAQAKDGAMPQVRVPPQVAEPEAFEEERTFKLRKPLTRFGDNGPEKVHQVTLRTPSLDDMFELPLPYRTVGSSGQIEIVFDGPLFKRWLQKLVKDNLSMTELGTMWGGDGRTIYEWVCANTNPGPN